jgi:hypothetical protein
MLNSRIPDGIYKDEKGGHSGVGALGQILSVLAAANAQNEFEDGGSAPSPETLASWVDHLEKTAESDNGRLDIVKMLEDLKEQQDNTIQPTNFTGPPAGPPLVVTPPSDNVITKVGNAVGDGIDKILDFLHLPNPTKIIGAPKQKSGVVVWGPSGGSSVVGMGTTGGGTQVGATTGNAALDAVLNRVTGVLRGKVAADEILDMGVLKEVLVGAAADETGMSTDAVQTAIEGMGAVVDATKVAAATKIQNDAAAKAAKDAGVEVYAPDYAAIVAREAAKATQSPPIDSTGPPFVTDSPPIGPPPVEDDPPPIGPPPIGPPPIDPPFVTGEPVLADAPPVKVDLAEDIIYGPTSDAELDAVLTDIGGGGGTGVTPEQIISQGGMDTVSTEKAGLAYINALYNPALSLAENMALLRGNITEEEDIVDSAIYYGGGMIQNTNMTDEINRLLRRY